MSKEQIALELTKMYISDRYYDTTKSYTNIYNEVYHQLNYDLEQKDNKQLLQENKELKEEIEHYITKLGEYTYKIYEAIEHIENTKNNMILQDRYYIDGDIILEILKGDFNE